MPIQSAADIFWQSPATREQNQSFKLNKMQIRANTRIAEAQSVASIAQAKADAAAAGDERTAREIIIPQLPPAPPDDDSSDMLEKLIAPVALLGGVLWIGRMLMK